MSDSKEAIRTLPANVAHLWDVTDTGKRLCRNSVVDLVRAMATRTSWSAIAEAINEMKMTEWVKSTTIVYLQLCESLGIQPSSVPSAMPEAWRISHKWVRRLFVTDANERRGAICQELAAEKSQKQNLIKALPVVCRLKILYVQEVVTQPKILNRTILQIEFI